MNLDQEQLVVTSIAHSAESNVTNSMMKEFKIASISVSKVTKYRVLEATANKQQVDIRIKQSC